MARRGMMRLRGPVKRSANQPVRRRALCLLVSWAGLLGSVVGECARDPDHVEDDDHVRAFGVRHAQDVSTVRADLYCTSAVVRFAIEVGFRLT